MNGGDWFTYLLILIFFVFPLIQQMLEAAKRGQAPPPVPEDEETGIVEERPAARLPRPETGERSEEVAVARRSSGGWSEGWGDWPGQVVTAESPVEGGDESLATSPEPSASVLWKAESLPEAEIEPEPVYVPRFAIDDVSEIGQTEQASISVSGFPAEEQFAAAVPGRRIHVAAAIRSPASLREAIVLKEVLGPPKGLRFDS